MQVKTKLFYLKRRNAGRKALAQVGTILKEIRLLTTYTFFLHRETATRHFRRKDTIHKSMNIKNVHKNQPRAITLENGPSLCCAQFKGRHLIC